ncbi:MAG TPA: DUF4870 domain-containing protein [Cryptosporangiaceae bacterium]|nr:DUF4870 domain-containing protein [Cryptosporangiaceae bacterium]
MTENSDPERSAQRPDDAPQAPSFEPPTPPGSATPPPDAGTTPPSAPSYGDPTAPSYGSPPPPPPPGAPTYATPPPTAAPGYGAPQAGGYPPQQGGYGQPPAGGSAADTKTWNMISHFGGAAGAFVGGGLFGWVAPLISMMSKGNENPNVRMQAIQALNFQITWSIATAVAWIVYVCGSAITLGFGALILWVLPLTTVVIAIVFGIIAGVKANSGQPYNYPMSIKMLK